MVIITTFAKPDPVTYAQGLATFLMITGTTKSPSGISAYSTNTAMGRIWIYCYCGKNEKMVV